MMIRNKVNFAIFICFIVSIGNVNGWRTFWKGRRDGGNLIPPHMNLTRNQLPPDRWFDQKLDHFTENNDAIWKQVSSNDLKN